MTGSKAIIFKNLYKVVRESTREKYLVCSESKEEASTIVPTYPHLARSKEVLKVKFLGQADPSIKKGVILTEKLQRDDPVNAATRRRLRIIPFKAGNQLN